MIKKILSVLLLLVISLTLSACQEEITITTELENIEMVAGDTFQITYTTNDLEGIDISSMDSEVLTVDANGLVSAVDEGTTVVVLRSLKDEEKFVEITFTVFRLVTLSTEDNTLSLTTGETLLVEYESNADVIFTSANTELFVVDEDGLITAKQEGVADLTITSDYDNTVEIIITVTVRKLVTLDVTILNDVLIVTDEKQIDFTSNDEVTFSSSDTSVLSVSATGVVKANGFGEATVLITSLYDSRVTVEVYYTVYKNTLGLEITGYSIVNFGLTTQLVAVGLPEGAISDVTWSSNDESIATVDANGLVTALQIGIVSILATSTLNTEVVEIFEIEVVNAILVDSSASSGDTLSLFDIDFVYGEKLFSTVQAAIDNADEGTNIYINDGTYTETIDIDVSGVSLFGVDSAIIDGIISISANNILITNLEFTNNTTINNSVDISNFIFTDNEILGSTLTVNPFIDLDGVTDVEITNNVFNSLLTGAISINDFLGGLILIEENLILGATSAISITADSEYDITTEINVIRNDIQDVVTGINIDLLYGTEQKSIEAYARFNSVVNYSSFGATSNVGSEVDFTLNFWGVAELDYLKFENIDPDLLRAFYIVKADILAKADEHASIPAMIIVTNPITELLIGTVYTIEYDLFPMNIDTHRITYRTSDPSILAININGEVTPVRSGTATVTVRSTIDATVKYDITITVTTPPGIELTPSNINNNLIVGDTFTLGAEVFPLPMVGSPVVYESSNEAIATIDAAGLVTTVSAGNVVFTVSLASDPTVLNTFTTSVYDELDPDKLLDFLTMNQVSYSTMHEWTAYGFVFNYLDKRYESVSRYLFGEIPVNTSKMVPVTYGIRPGEPMDDLALSGITTTNPQNVYWVVVHDTANTSQGAGASAHANYLYNNALAGNTLWVSWHYTVDPLEIFQHLPEDERGYHAGDGSSNPTDGYLKNGTVWAGGGNRNGIGIEMSVEEYGDTFLTWQRTAKLATDIAVRYNLPLSQIKYHNDFSGKDCPNTLRNAGLIPLFEIMKSVEYEVRLNHDGAVITFESYNLEYLDNNGRVIKMPDYSLTVSYQITVVEDGVTTSRVFYTYLPGTIK